MIADFFSSARFLGRGLHLIQQPGLRRFVAIPLTINIVIFAGMIFLGYHYYSMVIDWLTPDWLAGWEDNWWVGWAIGIIEFFLWMIFGAAVLIIVTYTFALIANFIAAPFNSLLAEKVEHHLKGTLDQSNESISHILASIPKTLASELHKLAYLLIWMLPLLLLQFVPLLQLAAPVAWFAFGAWMLALEYLDYPMGNHNYRFGQIKAYMKSRRGLALGFGGGVTLMTVVPIVNLVAMPIAVAGATAMWVERLSAEITTPPANTEQ